MTIYHSILKVKIVKIWNVFQNKNVYKYEII